MSGGLSLRLSILPRRLSIPPGSLKRWEKRRLTGNVGLSTAYWFSICKISRIIHVIDFILQFLYLACEFKDSTLIFDQFSPWNCRSRNEHLSTRSRLSVESLLNGPTPHDHGRQRSDRGAQHLSCPYVALTVHWAVSVRRSTTGRWPSRPRSRLRGRSPPKIGRWSPARALSVSPHSGADGLVQGELPPISPEFWPFLPALPVTLAPPLTATETRLAWAGIGGACRFTVPRGGHLPFLGSPALPPSRLTGGIATPTRRYHGRMLIHPSLPACVTRLYLGDGTHAGSEPSRVRRRLFSTRLEDPISLAIHRT